MAFHGDAEESVDARLEHVCIKSNCELLLIGGPRKGRLLEERLVEHRQVRVDDVRLFHEINASLVAFEGSLFMSICPLLV